MSCLVIVEKNGGEIMFDISNVKVVLNYVLEISRVSNTFKLSTRVGLLQFCRP